MALFSIIWNYARKKGITTLPWPAAGMERSKWKNKETPVRFKVTADIFEAIYQAGDQVLRDCMDTSSATGMRLTDVIGVVLPASDILTLKASKTGKDADFDISLSTVLPELVRRRRALRADHLMLLSTPTGKPVTLRMLDARWTFAREFAAVNCEQGDEAELAKAIRATKLRYMRKYAGDLAGSDEDAQRLLQHSSITTTRAHYRTAVANLKPVR
jgi:integrase